MNKFGIDIKKLYSGYEVIILLNEHKRQFVKAIEDVISEGRPYNRIKELLKELKEED